jgi:hypothetical protein
MLAFFRNDMGFGGNNGFTDFKELLGSTCRPTHACAAGRDHGADAGASYCSAARSSSRAPGA